MIFINITSEDRQQFVVVIQETGGPLFLQNNHIAIDIHGKAIAKNGLYLFFCPKGEKLEMGEFLSVATERLKILRNHV
jgi:hypothetical protein